MELVGEPEDSKSPSQTIFVDSMAVLAGFRLTPQELFKCIVTCHLNLPNISLWDETLHWLSRFENSSKDGITSLYQKCT